MNGIKFHFFFFLIKVGGQIIKLFNIFVIKTNNFFLSNYLIYLS